MKKIFQTISLKTYAHRELLAISTVSLVVLSALAFTIVEKASAQSFAPIYGQMGLGARGGNVSNLQTFIAANSSMYPEGLVTGYYGRLTFNAVKKFQAQYGLDQVGRAGPLTLAKMNDLIAMGGWSMSSDVSGPQFSNVSQTQSPTTATFNFNTNENTVARVVYSTSPQMFSEGDMYSNGFGAMGGFSSNSLNGLSTSHTVKLTNLNSNTIYYYTVIATDAQGNVSIVGPNNAFRSN